MPFTPSSIEKTAPHFGHLTFVSFVYVAHPTEKTANIANAKKMLTHFLITLHLLSSIYVYVGDPKKSFYKLWYNKNWIPKILSLVKRKINQRKINLSSPVYSNLLIGAMGVNGGVHGIRLPNLFLLFCPFLGRLFSFWMFHPASHNFSTPFTHSHSFIYPSYLLFVKKFLKACQYSRNGTRNDEDRRHSMPPMILYASACSFAAFCYRSPFAGACLGATFANDAFGKELYDPSPEEDRPLFF